MSQKTWGGRFSGGTDDRVEAFTESISIDRRLYRHDVRASQAHARMLAEVGLLTAAEADQIVAALDAIAGDISVAGNGNGNAANHATLNLDDQVDSIGYDWTIDGSNVRRGGARGRGGNRVRAER